MQGSVRCGTTDKLHPARQASFWSMKWLETGMVNPWSLPFSRYFSFSLSLSLSLSLPLSLSLSLSFSLASHIVWSDLNSSFRFLGWDIHSLHQLSLSDVSWWWWIDLCSPVLLRALKAHSRVLLSDIRKSMKLRLKGKVVGWLAYPVTLGEGGAYRCGE